MKDGSHNLSENIVIVADYYLVKSIDESFIPIYIECIMNKRNAYLDEEKFLSLFCVDEKLRDELMKLINNILEAL
jgi:hypothetical protein